MDSRFLQHRADIYRSAIEKKNLEEVRILSSLHINLPCKVTASKGKWIKGEYVMARKEDTIIMFSLGSYTPMKGDKISVNSKEYLVSDSQENEFISLHGGSIQVICNLI